MKDDTVDLVKFRRLMRRLDLREWQAVGVLESLWRFTRKNAPMGDVGRFTNVDIAAAIDWRGDADDLIDALRDGWLDDVGGLQRLVCHDWYDHAPSFVVRRINNKFGVGDTKTPTDAGRKAWNAWASGESSPGSQQRQKAPADGRISPPTTPSSGRISDQMRPVSRARAGTQPNPTQPPPPTPSEPIASGEPEPLSDGWRSVVVVVADCGVGDAEGACEAARDRGASPGEVRRLCDHFRSKPGAWGVGLLHAMISKIRPGEKVNWPEPSAEYLERERKAGVEAKSSEWHRKNAEQIRQREERKREREAAAADRAASGVDPVAEFKRLTKKQTNQEAGT